MLFPVNPILFEIMKRERFTQYAHESQIDHLIKTLTPAPRVPGPSRIRILQHKFACTLMQMGTELNRLGTETA